MMFSSFQDAGIGTSIDSFYEYLLKARKATTFYYSYCCYLFIPVPEITLSSQKLYICKEFKVDHMIMSYVELRLNVLQTCVVCSSKFVSLRVSFVFAETSSNHLCSEVLVF